MQEALSDHHSRASTSLQVPKMKGGLLQSGNDSSPAPPLDDKITKMKKRSPVEIFLGRPIPVRRKGGWVTKETQCFPYLPFPFPESSWVVSEACVRGRGGGGRRMQTNTWISARPANLARESIALSPSVPSPPLHPSLSLKTRHYSPIYSSSHITN